MFSMIAARTEYLPTDLVFEPSTNWFYNNAGSILLVSTIVMITSIFMTMCRGTEGLPQTIRVLGILLVIITMPLNIGMMIYTFATAADKRDASAELAEQNRDNFITNVETVYDVEVQKLDESDLTPTSKVELIVSQDGVAYEVIGTQDPETYEPSLMVIASPTSEVTELRKK